MAKKILLTDNGVHREATDGYITVNGVYRKIKEGFVTVNGVYRPFMSSGLALSELPVGTLVSMNVNGVAKRFIKVHQGLPSSMYDSSCDGTWVLMKDIYETREWHSSNANNYQYSTINTYLNSDFLGLFDSDIQSLIKQVKIPYVNGLGDGGSVASGANGLSTKIFLLSTREVGYTGAGQTFDDGICLGYFVGTNGTSADTKRIAYYNGTATSWWLRSIMANNVTYARFVRETGLVSGISIAGKLYGVRPALILPNEALVNPTPNADGSYTLLV